MAVLYGSDSQYVFATPQCAGYVEQPEWHYFLLVYLPMMSAFATLLNGWIVSLLVFDVDGRQLLQQPQHVYVLGCAITNVCVALGCNFILWIAAFLVPCIDLGVVPCFIKNFFNFTGSYQVLFNVCLICYDRWRMVRLGTQYNHALEVRRATWLLCATSAFSVVLFIVPEFGVPALTGIWRVPPENDLCRCDPSQNQHVPEFGGLNVADVMAGLLVVLQWAFIVAFTASTAWLLYNSASRKRKTKVGPSALNSDGQTTRTLFEQKNLANARKQFRATMIMFGIVVVTLVTNGPVAVLLAWLQINPHVVSDRWWPVQTLLILQLSTPAIDPFVFALTLPRLRARARKTAFGRGLLYMLTLRAAAKSAVTNDAKHTTVVAVGSPQVVATVGESSAAQTAQSRQHIGGDKRLKS